MEKRPIEVAPDNIHEAVEIAQKAGLLQTKESLTLKVGAITMCSGDHKFVRTTARNYYRSERIQRFIKTCEEEGIPCFILSLERGILEPDSIVDPYYEESTDWEKAARLVQEADVDILLFYDPQKLMSKLDFHADLLTIEKPKIYVVNTLEALVEMYHALERKQEQLANELMNVPDENKTWRAIIHTHYRGKSAHFDLRLERPNDLIGWTIFAEPKGALKDEVNTLKEAKEWDKKIDWKLKGSNKVQCTPKSPEPKPWLTYEKVVEPGQVGATAEEPGVFSIYDKGTVEYLAQKPYMHEYWLHMKHYKGRILFRMLKNPYGEKPKFVWFCWFPEDQTPYVLTDRSIKSRYHTKPGHSELPKHIRQRIPRQYHYWKETDSKKAFQIRKQLIEAIKKKEVKLAATKYALVHHYWRGPHIIREGPTEQHYDLYIQKPGENKCMHFVLTDNILDSDSTTGYQEKDADIKYMTIGQDEPESIPPGTSENPTKDTPCYMKQLKTGEAIIYEDSPLLKKIELKGIGLFLFTKEQGASLWNVQKTTALARLSLSATAEGVALSPGVWNGFYYPPEVIKAAKSKIEHIPVDVEHKEDLIVGETGKATIKGNDLVVELNIYDDRYKDAKCGLSIDAIIEVDKIRKIVKRIVKFKSLSLVSNPACRVCFIKEVKDA